MLLSDHLGNANSPADSPLAPDFSLQSKGHQAGQKDDGPDSQWFTPQQRHPLDVLGIVICPGGCGAFSSPWKGCFRPRPHQL